MSQEDWYRMTLRMPPELVARLRKLANGSGNSLTIEIINRLNKSCEFDIMNNNDLDLTPSELADKTILFVKKVCALAEDKPLPKDEILNKEEREILKYFSQADKEEQALLVNSLPELISIFKKMR